MTDEIQKHFERLYESPDPYKTESRFFERSRLANAFRLLPSHRRFRSAVDLGCGEGEFTLMLSSVADSVTGIDFVPMAIERAKAKGPQQQVRFQQGRWDAFLATIAPVELVTCNAALEYMDDKHQALRAVARALQPNGVFLLIGTVGKRWGYPDYDDWLTWTNSDFKILQTAVVSPVLRGQNIVNHPWCFFKRPVYDGAMLLANWFPRQLCRHLGILCEPK